MKNLKLTTFFILSFLLFSLNSCDNEPLDTGLEIGNNNGNSNIDISSIYYKWWYDSENFSADIYFHSNGIYEQKIELLGNEYLSSGDWFWENEEERIMKIENLEGTAQAASEVWFKLSNIQSTSFNIQQSADGTSYSAARLYFDTDN